MNEKRGQPLEPFPFQSSKSWTRSFLASRLPARIFPLVLPFQAIPLFLRFQGSLSLSFSHGHYHRRRAPLLMVFSRRSNSSFVVAIGSSQQEWTIPLLFRSKLYAYDPIIRDKFTSSTMDRTEWIITESVQYRFSHSYLHSIIHLHG